MVYAFPFFPFFYNAQIYVSHRDAKGSRKRQAVMDGKCSMIICENELVNVTQITAECQGLEIAANEWEKKYTELQLAHETLYVDMVGELHKQSEGTAEVTGRAKEYAGVCHHGKPYSEVSTRGQQRQRLALKSRAQKAQWFSETFAFTLKALTFSEKTSNTEVSFNFVDETTSSAVQCAGSPTAVAAASSTAPVADNNTATASRKRQRTERRYTELPEEEKEVIMKLVYLLDRFSGSDALYHELTQLYDAMPRSYMLWCYRRKLEKSFNVKQLGGSHEGAYIPTTPLLQNHICRMPAKKGVTDLPQDGVQIKISGDGAEFSNSSTYVLMTYVLLDKDDLESSAKSANHITFAAVKCREDYHELKSALASFIWEELNTLLSTKSVIIDDKSIPLQITL